ncbi:hypothetical protein ALC60_09478 [Trachymyrmex zeteki]|uniref:Uncharacterized protein n=1 Tax=Mycetomoellerius zeteki TaxID=64791 RepID=A0A151WU93_9HYME|nr:hypothetical protein ALC60_09478 [Trachymyrmex zeteki]
MHILSAHLTLNATESYLSDTKEMKLSIKRQGGNPRTATFQRYLRDTITSLTCLAEVKSFRKDERKKIGNCPRLPNRNTC